MSIHSCPFEKLRPSQLIRDDSFFMSMAYNEAIEGWKKDEVPIGAIVVQDGNIIGSAHNQTIEGNDPTAHAEILAISQAANAIGDWRLNNCTLYVTKEPCPMCSGASIMARLDRVVYAMKDPKMGCLGGVTALHKINSLNHHLEAQGGILEAPCGELIRAFFEMKRKST